MTLQLRYLLLFGMVVSGVAALVCRTNNKCRRNHSEKMLDKALDESFPASDPTGSQDFAIPVNRL